MEEKRETGPRDVAVIPGIVTSRRCPTCGHHEVGYETPDGRFVPLRPGDRIGVFPPSPTPPLPEAPPRHVGTRAPSGDEDAGQWVPWAPEPILPSRSLCRKYGVLVKNTVAAEMRPDLYESAYRRKLEDLIEKEGAISLSILLNHRFAAAHLASGDSKRAVQAMWEELDEVRTPVMRVREWFADPGEASLLKMIHPLAIDQLKGPVPGPDQLREELNTLTLEDFLDVL